MSLTRQTILDLLSQTPLPGEGGEDILSAGLVRALTVREGQVSFVLEAPAEISVDLVALREALTDSISALEGVTKVQAYLGDPAQEPGVAEGEALPGIGGVARIVLVGSGKGGVGKSTVTANLAQACLRKGLKVGVLDADIYGPSQPRLHQTDGRPVSYDGTLIPIAARGVKLMSLGLLTEPDQALVWRGPILHDTLTQLLFQVRWAPLDVLFIDLPPGTGDVPLTILQQVAVDGAVLVSTPQELSLLDLRRAHDLFERTETPVLGLIENMSTHICSQCGAEEHIFGAGLEDFAKGAGIPYLGRLPLAGRICDAADHGRDLADDPAAQAEIAQFDQIAEAILAATPAEG